MIILEQLAKDFGTRTLFAPTNLKFPDGERVALVGPNGAGKTTLLRIITGETEPSSGRVVIPKNITLGYLPQEPNPNPRENVLDECIHGAEKFAAMQERLDFLLKRIEANGREEDMIAYSDLEQMFAGLGGYALSSRAESILIGLGFSPEQMLLSPTSLSGGWRMRLELAKLFLNEPDVLLLDEPTNHLDLPSLIWVEDYLQGFRGTLIFVSHDRPLLNRLATMTLELTHGKLSFYRGNFDEYLEQKEMKQLQAQAQLQNIQRRKDELQSFVDRFGASAAKARQAQSRVKMLARLRSIEASISIEEAQSSISLQLPVPPKADRVVLRVKELSIGYGQKILAKKINLEVQRGMKIAIVGANGIGKSTFLKTLMSLNPPCAGEFAFGERVRLGYFAQEQSDALNVKQTVLENVLDVNHEVGERQARLLLGNLLFRGEDVFKKVGVLSGGEKNRVGLARILMSKANVLIMDEPTNHLDMSSVGVLGDALSKFEGTIIFVSHDREFIDAVCTHVYAMYADGHSVMYEGKLAENIAKITGQAQPSRS